MSASYSSPSRYASSVKVDQVLADIEAREQVGREQQDDRIESPREIVNRVTPAGASHATRKGR